MKLISSFFLNLQTNPTEMKLVYLLCCDTGQNDTIGKIELIPLSVLSTDNTNCKNDIQWFL